MLKNRTWGTDFPTIYQLKNIRFVEGEGGAGATPPPTPPTPPTEADKTPPEADKEYLAQLRQEAKDNRLKAKEANDKADAQAAELAKIKAAFGAALGIEPEETDPEKLNAKVTELTTKVSTTETELTKAQAEVAAQKLATTVALTAPGLGGNAELLLTNKDFIDSIAEVDPSDKAAIQAAITKAIQTNAALKAVPARSGSGEHQGPTVQNLEAQLKAAEEKKDFKLTIALKRQIAAARAKQ